MFTIIAIKHSYEEVIKFLEELFSNLGVLSSGKTEDYIRLTQKGDWSVLIINHSLPMPALSLKISKELECKVITTGYAKTDGSFHYSEIEKGNVIKLYSHIMEETSEKQGLTLIEVYKTAISKKQFNIEPGFNPDEDSLEYGSEEFFSAYSEIDFLEIAYEDSSEKDKRLFLTKQLPYKAYGENFGVENNTWDKLLD